MNAPTELVGDRIRALCELQAISRKSLADDLHISPATLSKIESGTQRFPQDLAHALSVRFGLPLGFFSAQDTISEVVTPTFRKRARARVIDEKRIVRLCPRGDESLQQPLSMFSKEPSRRSTTAAQVRSVPRAVLVLTLGPHAPRVTDQKFLNRRPR